MDNKQNEFEGLNNIDNYLLLHGKNKPVEVPELEDIINVVASKANLNPETTEQIIKFFFEEIRSLMLKGEIIRFINFGSFFISSPKVKNTVKRISPMFKAAIKLKDLINGR